MTGKINVRCDYDTVVGHSNTAWENIANYQVEKVEESAGYTKFKVNYIPLGELGTFEVRKVFDSCTVVFSDLSIIDNYDEWFRQAKKEAEQEATDRDSFRLRLGREHIEKFKLDPNFLAAKKRAWKETIDIYKSMIEKLQALPTGTPVEVRDPKVSERREKVRELSLQKKTITAIANEIPTNRSTVIRDRDELGITKKRKPKRQ